MEYKDEEFSRKDLEILTGKLDPGDPKQHILLLAKVLKDPMQLPFLLEEICSLELGDDERHDLRMALIRLQIDCDLRMQEDIQHYQQRRYVAQVIEILLFEELMLAPREPEEFI
jgi:hypothetical protein